MKLLMISTDRNIFKEGSDVSLRMADYGSICDELSIIVYGSSSLPREKRLRDNIVAYSTHSRSKIAYVFNGYRIAKDIVKGNPHDWIVTTQDPFETGLLGYMLSRKFKIPLQAQIHTDFLSPFFKAESFAQHLRAMFGMWLIRQTYQIRVVSERIKESLVREDARLKEKIVVIPVFVDIEKIERATVNTNLRTRFSGFKQIILMASRLTREKNIGMAIDAMMHIKDRFPETLLLIVGEGPEKNNLKSHIANRKLQDNIIIEPWANDLLAYYKSADIFLLTSNYEGYGRTVIEAMAAGVPVCMTNVGIAGDLVRNHDTGMVVEVHNTEALEKALNELIKDPSLRSRLAQNGRKEIEALPDKKAYYELHKDAFQKLSRI